MDDQEKRGGGSGFLLGLLLGAIAGAAAGLLWSPRSGAQNREGLAEKLPGLGSTGPEVAARASDELTSRVEEGREAFLEGAAETRERMQREIEERRKADG